MGFETIYSKWTKEEKRNPKGEFYDAKRNDSNRF